MKLESHGEEEMKAANRKRGLARFQSCSGSGAAAHDDIAISRWRARCN